MNPTTKIPQRDQPRPTFPPHVRWLFAPAQGQRVAAALDDLASHPRCNEGLDRLAADLRGEDDAGDEYEAMERADRFDPM